ncbi:hypothetical protein KC906_02580, partial [Candidatus Kaiserbacteria bacterium]|nr:hypothetical protein [Candidatus Kaiserbacteria bacterium]
MRAAVLCVLTLLIGTAQAGAITNGSFEDGFTGWTQSGQVSIVSGYTVSSIGSTHNLSATDGDKFVIMFAGNSVTSLISDAFYAFAGSELTFDWLFHARDYLPFNDYVLALLLDGSPVETKQLASVSSVGEFGFTGWNTDSFFIPVDGSYQWAAECVNLKDSVNDSVCGFDNVSMTMPGTGTVSTLGDAPLMAIGGLVLIGFARVREKFG